MGVVGQVPHKGDGVGLTPPAYQVADHQLAIGIHPGPRPDAPRIVREHTVFPFPYRLVFRIDERPDFIGFNILGLDVADVRIVIVCRHLSGLNKQRPDRIKRYVCHPARCSHGHPIQQATYNLHPLCV